MTRRSAVSMRRGQRSRGLVMLAAAILALAVIGGSGSLIDAQSATFIPSPIPLVGRTSTVCTVGPEEAGSTTSVSAVVIRQAPGRRGSLTGVGIGDTPPALTLTEQGKGKLLPDRTTSMILEGEGVMATASSGGVFGAGDAGVQAGLMAAPCMAPGTAHWFVGVGSEESLRSELFLTNPDDSQAEVDLEFFGPNGLLVVPGSPGLVIGARSSRRIALESLVQTAGPLSVVVRASEGRVSAVSRDLRTQDLVDPRGADWHTGAVPPATSMVIPGVPEGAGTRELVLVNPGASPAEVGVQVLGQLGAFAPIGAERVEVPAESTVSVSVQAGLAGQSGALRLVSDSPVTGSVVSASLRDDAQSDSAVQPALPALVRTGVVALADTDSVDSELILSNGSAAETTLSFELLSYEGVTVRSDDVLIGGYSTSTRRLSALGPAYLVVRVPDRSAIHGGVVLTQPEGTVAGLASIPLTSPDVASRAPNVVLDPTVGR